MRSVDSHLVNASGFGWWAARCELRQDFDSDVRRVPSRGWVIINQEWRRGQPQVPPVVCATGRRDSPRVRPRRTTWMRSGSKST